MRKYSNNSQRGAAHIIAIVAVVVIIAALGYVGFRAFTNNRSLGDMAANKVASIAASKECIDQYSDEDLCKFLTSWKMNDEFKMESVSTIEGQTSTSMMAVAGDKSHFKLDGQYEMEMKTFGDTTYTKAGDTWWKQAPSESEPTDPMPTKDDLFDAPSEDSEEQDLTNYVKIGKEACGDLNCFKYQIVDPEDSETTEFIWFDDKDYLIRKTLSESSDGTSSEATYSYENVSIDMPSPIKELGPNQYIMPGETEPQTMPEGPTEAEIQEMMQQYAQ